MDEVLERIRAILDEEGVKPRNYTVKEAIERLCREELPRLRHPNKARSHIGRLAAFVGGEPITAIPALASRYREAHPHLSAATINRRLAWLRRIARLAHRRWGWLARPVYTSLDTEHNARHRYLTLAEVERLLEACDHLPTLDAVTLAVYTGMRQGEIFALTQADVRGNCLWLPDSKNRERSRLTPAAALQSAHDAHAFQACPRAGGVSGFALSRRFALSRPAAHDGLAARQCWAWLEGGPRGPRPPLRPGREPLRAPLGGNEACGARKRVQVLSGWFCGPA